MSVANTFKAIFRKGRDSGVIVEGLSREGEGDSGTATPEKKSEL